MLRAEPFFYYLLCKLFFIHKIKKPAHNKKTFKLQYNGDLNKKSTRNYYLDRGEHQSIDAHGSSEAEVTQLNDCSLAEKDILRLHVTMQNTVSV